MRPGHPKWATNANHVAGAWIGQPNKDEPSPAKLATGREPTERPVAEEFNWLHWGIALMLAACGSVRAINYLEADTAGMGLVGGGHGSNGDAAYDPTTGFFGAATDGSGGGSANREVYADGGMTWAQNTPWGGAFDTQAIGYDIDPATGLRTAGFNAADSLFYTANTWPGAWFAWSGIGATGQTWTYPSSDGNGLWVAWNNTLGTMWQTTDPTAVAIAVVTVDPGLASSPFDIVHSRHQALAVDQYDTGNPFWIAVNATEITTSADGLTWTPSALHLVPVADGLCYTRSARRWHLFDGTAGNLQHVYSDDNGTTWVPGTVINAGLGLSTVRAATDDYNQIVIAVMDAGTAYLYASLDDGDTWERVPMPGNWTTVASPVVQVAYGGGRFAVLGDNGAAPASYLHWYSIAASER